MHKLFSLFATLFLVIGLSLPVSAMDTEVSAPVVNINTVNINTATIETLTELKGVGPKLAREIVAWREANGDFVAIDQLLEIKGIGPKFLDKNKSLMTLE